MNYRCIRQHAEVRQTMQLMFLLLGRSHMGLLFDVPDVFCECLLHSSFGGRLPLTTIVARYCTSEHSCLCLCDCTCVYIVVSVYACMFV